jgi:hypothetical protein
MQPRRAILRVLTVAVLAGAAAFLVRKFLVEPDFMGQLCGGNGAPSWCLVRQAVVLGFVFNAYGYASVAAALLAMVFRAAPFAWFALAIGILGCVLYRFDPAGAGVLLAALALARLGAGRVEGRAPEQEA